MKAYFDRHQPDKKSPHWDEPSPGKVAWYAWGGDAGYSWAKSVVEKLNKVQKGDVQGHAFHGNQWTGVGAELHGVLDRAKAFYDAGGKVEVLKPSKAKEKYYTPELAEKLDKLHEASGEDLSHASMIRAALHDGEDDEDYGTRILVATDKDGNVVAAMKAYTKDYDPYQDRTGVSVPSVGSLGTVRGAASALEQRVAGLAASKEKYVFGDVGLDSASFHYNALGRQVEGNHSYWTPEQCRQLADAITTVKKGDVPGHDFHGNQWTGGLGGGEAPLTPAEQQGIQAWTDNCDGWGSPSREELEEIAKRANQEAPELWRGINLKAEDDPKLMKSLQVGETVKLPFSSWSRKKLVGEQFASEDSPMGNNGDTHIVFHTSQGARGVNAEPYAIEDFRYQAEWLIPKSSYKVVSVTKDVPYAPLSEDPTMPEWTNNNRRSNGYVLVELAPL
jgi:hypothetical protein